MFLGNGDIHSELFVKKVEDIRSAFNQECESIHKIQMNKVTEVSLARKKGTNVVVRFPH